MEKEKFCVAPPRIESWMVFCYGYVLKAERTHIFYDVKSTTIIQSRQVSNTKAGLFPYKQKYCSHSFLQQLQQNDTTVRKFQILKGVLYKGYVLRGEDHH